MSIDESFYRKPADIFNGGENTNVPAFRRTAMRKFNENGYCDTPQRFDLQMLAPQLSNKGVDNVLQTAFDQGRSYFYGPGCYVLGAYHAFVLIHDRGCAEDLHWCQLGWLGSGRDKHSYLAQVNNVPENFQSRNYNISRPYQDAINDMQTALYGDTLIRDDWYAVLEATVADPTKRDRHHDLKPTYRFWCALDDPMVIEVDEATLYPRLFQLEHAIKHIVNDPWRGAELSGHREHMKVFFCSKCGGPLQVNHCGYCGARITAREAHRVSTRHPIPAKLAAKMAIEEFDTHPFRAIKHYYNSWAQHGNHGVVAQAADKKAPTDGQAYNRVIDIGKDS